MSHFALPETPQAAVATLGGQPQIITLTLDLLLDRGIPLDTLVVVHLELENPRYRAAHRHLEHELATPRYAMLRYRPVIVRQWTRPVAELDTTESLEAARDTFDNVFRDLKQRGYSIHLCMSGGRRLLGYLGMLVAQHHFSYADRVWHLYSSDTVRAHSRDGRQMHLADGAESRLLPVPFQPLGWLASQPSTLPPPDPEVARCQQVYEALSEREQEILRAFVDGLDPKQVADRLCITIKTVDTHKSKIYQHCRIVWDLPDGEPRHYSWLREKFARFLEV